MGVPLGRQLQQAFGVLARRIVRRQGRIQVLPEQLLGKIQVPAGEFDAIRMRVIMRLDDETFWRWATECNYEIWWSPAVGASVREVKYAQFIDKGGGVNAIPHRTQNALLQLTSFHRAAA